MSVDWGTPDTIELDSSIDSCGGVDASDAGNEIPGGMCEDVSDWDSTGEHEANGDLCSDLDEDETDF